MESVLVEKKIRTVNDKEISTSALDQFINERLDTLKIAGLSLSIIQNNEVFYSRGYGYENTETQKKITDSTVFEAASISKPVFTYFVFKLVRRGILDLDKPVYKYLPKQELEYDRRYRRITTRMILTHTSGLPNWRSLESDKKLKLLFEPNTRYNYSGEGYQYLKDIICHLLKVNEEELEAMFQREVREEIGAKYLHFLWTPDMGSTKAYGHIEYSPTMNEFRHESNTGKLGIAYNLHSNAESYAIFLAHIMNLDRESDRFVQEIFRPQFEMPFPQNEYPRSTMFPIKRVNNRLRYQHIGNNADFKSYLHLYLEEGFGLVLMCNSDNFMSSNFARHIVEFLGDEWCGTY